MGRIKKDRSRGAHQQAARVRRLWQEHQQEREREAAQLTRFPDTLGFSNPEPLPPQEGP